MNSIVSTVGVLGYPWMRLLPDKSHFPLIFAVAGVLAADEAVSAMAPVHFRRNGRWLGWYNSPGSYQIAKLFRLLSNPSVHVDHDAATFFELDGSKGPKFRAVHSDTIIEETGHLASLLMNECAARRAVNVVEGRGTEVFNVTVAKLNHTPLPRVSLGRIDAYSPVFASIPIVVSVSTCVACGLFADWYSFSSILSGIITSGISCLAIGSGELVFTHPDPPAERPPGDGILGSGNEMVLLGGAGGAVNSITHGRFSLHFASGRQPQSIGWRPALLNTHFITQLLLVSKGSPYGQAMLATSLAVSWIYNFWLSSLGKKIQRDILLNDVLGKPVLIKHNLKTRRIAVVFVLLVLQPQEPTVIIDELLPNDTEVTEVWEKWKDTIVSRLLRKEKLKFNQRDWMLDGFTQHQRSLLESLYRDAEAAYDIYDKLDAPSE